MVVLGFNKESNINKNLERYLINLNKKGFDYFQNEINFKNYFLNRTEIVSDYYLTYFNNDIQYGSKYILKRLMDITFSLLGIAFLSPFFIIISLYIYFLDGSGVVIKQNRVGLHGKQFKMFKFRTMKKMHIVFAKNCKI